MQLRRELEPRQRHLGLFGATSVGVGAIVGGGILALAGVAFATTGPAAIVAFGLNGLIALLTALSFAEMASKFPESGGTYTFAKKVLSVESAFTVGWVVWFASIVASVLYAFGFAAFAAEMLDALFVLTRGDSPAWILSSPFITTVAIAATVALSAGLMLTSAGGGQWVNVGKVAVFAVLIGGGLWIVAQQPAAERTAQLRPFFTAGLPGLVQAMGYSFIALQGFDLIAAVGGEVRRPERNIPLAMVLSLGTALAIYLPLLLVIALVGPPPGTSIATAAAAEPEAIVAIAAENFLGPFGYWLVILAALLSMFSALQANLLAASRIGRAMALDRTLPPLLGRLNKRFGTPVASLLITTALVTAILLVLPDLAAAGAASSLIFLVTFALAHWIAVLVRQRSRDRPPPFRIPLFPLVPVVGGLACLALAIFQGLAVPSAGMIALMWLAIGAILFLALFARRARVMSASSTARDLELVKLRGHAPLVLVPLANPSNAAAMVEVANALAPPDIGRVLLLTIVVPPAGWQASEEPEPITRAQQTQRELLVATTRAGCPAEALTTIAADPMAEIARVAKLHQCEYVVLGLSEISTHAQGTPLERLLGAVDADIVVLRESERWRLAAVRRILIPVGGRGGHDELQARLVGSLTREFNCEVTFLRVLPARATPSEIRRVERDLRILAEDEMGPQARAEVVCHDDAVAAVAGRAADADLLVLGVQRLGRTQKLFGDFTRRIAPRTTCALMVISRRG